MQRFLKIIKQAILCFKNEIQVLLVLSAAAMSTLSPHSCLSDGGTVLSSGRPCVDETELLGKNSSIRPGSRASKTKTAIWYLLSGQPQSTMMRRKRRMKTVKRAWRMMNNMKRTCRTWTRWTIVSRLMMEKSRKWTWKATDRIRASEWARQTRQGGLREIPGWPKYHATRDNQLVTPVPEAHPQAPPQQLPGPGLSVCPWTPWASTSPLSCQV